MLGLQLQPTPAVSLLLLRSLETNVAQIPRTRPGSLAKSSNSGSLMHRILAKVGKDLGLLCVVFVETSVPFFTPVSNGGSLSAGPPHNAHHCSARSAHLVRDLATA